MFVKKEKGKGQECYNWYHYLWHLIAIGAVKRRQVEELRFPEEEKDVAYILEADAWALLDADKPGEGETIAQIDTGVNDRHPNIAPRVCGAVSFAVNPYGLRYPDRDPKEATDRKPDAPRLVRGAEKMLDDSLIGEKAWGYAERLAGDDPVAVDLIRRLRVGRGVAQQPADISRQRYSAHGTACAGLVVGAPVKLPESATPGSAMSARRATRDDGDGPIPYWGVAPGAKLLPIEISARPDAEQLIMAFLYAWEKQVSVIHFPREVPDPFRSHQYHAGEYDETRYVSPEARAEWDYFAKLFEAISNEIPIVCAAGNDGYDHLIYPASKAAEKNGVIAVGAVTYQARRAAYSNYCGSGTDNAITIAAPSDDQEVYTRYQVRLDKEAARWRDHNFDIYKDYIPTVKFAPQGVLTVDIPGRHGYSGGQLQGTQPEGVENRDRASLYTVFGGTSAASAIVAGAVALLQAKHRASEGRPLRGKEVKSRLEEAGAQTVSWPWLENGAEVEIRTDAPNGEGDVDFEQQFGPGVLDLRKLLAE
jgi:subtilisin family serine protease